MACVLVPDALWNLIEPLLPIPSSKPQGGDRAGGPGLPRGRDFCAPQRYSVADTAKSTRLRLRHDLLAKGERLAARRNLGFDPFRVAGLSFP